jgi:hypothetical protein
MKNAIDRVFTLLCLKSSKPEQYENEITFGERYTAKWDEPTVLRTVSLEFGLSLVKQD